MTAMLIAEDQNPGLPGLPRRIAIAAVLGAMLLVVLDSALVNVALPTMALSLHASAANSVMIITAYQTALVMALLPCAALGESLGFRRVFAGGVALFIVSSVLCSMAPSLAWLVAARFFQGLGGAAVMALGIALLRFTVPHWQLGAAIGWNALTVALASAAGPSIGALILSGTSWHWLFAVNLPLGVAVLLAARQLPNPAGTKSRPDFFSVAINGAAFAALVIGAELMPANPAFAIALFAAAALGFMALVKREMPKQSPLIPIDLLRIKSFRISVIASVCCFTGQTMGMVALPFYLQHELHQNVLMTGLYITPWPLTVALAVPITARLTDHVSAAWLCLTGGVFLSAGLAGASAWPLHGDPALLVPFIMLCGLGFGMFQVPNNRNMFLAAPRGRSGAAGGMQGTARLVGQTAGGVIMTALFVLTSISGAPRIGLGIGALLTFIAGLVSVMHVNPKTSNALRI